MVADRQITTWLSKQVVFDYNQISDFAGVESEYLVLCVSPDVRYLLLSHLVHYAEWSDRYINFPDIRTRDDLISRAFAQLGAEMACSEDIEQLNTNLASMALTLTEIRDALAPSESSIDARLSDIDDKLNSLVLALEALDPSLIDRIEEVLNGVGVILGAPSVAVSGP